MLADLKKEVENRMKKSLDAVHAEFTKLRTGRAHPSLLDHVMVSYYGKDMPLNQVATLTVADARTLTVSPWDKGLVPAIEKAILTANLGLNPITSGNIMRIPLPALSEERRKEMIKVARSEAENGRIAIRSIRRDANNHLKDQLKKKLITEDAERRTQDEIQKITDRYIKDVDKVLSQKEADLMQV